MLRSFQIDVLNEIKDQIVHQLHSTDYNDSAIHSYKDVVNMIDDKIVKIDKAMDAELEDMKRLDDERWSNE